MADISEVDIANMALDHIGEGKSIESLDQPDNEEAAKIRRWYDPSRQQTLEGFDWSFARKRQDLALSDEPGTLEWAFRYQYPIDCVAMRRLTNPWGYVPDDIPYTIETHPFRQTKTILTNLEDAEGVYTFNLQNTSLMPMMFVNTFALCLAMNIAYPLTQRRQLVGDLKQEYAMAVMAASAYSANESQEQQHRDASWVRARQ